MNGAERTPKPINVITLPVEQATPQSLDGYGYVIGSPEAEVWGRIDYYGDDVQVRTPVQFVSNDDMTLNLVTFNRRAPQIRWMEYHSKHTQTFIPLAGKPFIMVLGKPTRRRPDQSMDERLPDLPNLSDVRAFHFDGSCGVCMHVGTWHEVPFPLQDRTNFVAIVTNETNRNLEVHDKEFFEADGGDLLKRNLQHRFGAQFLIDLGDNPGRGAEPMKDKVTLTCAVTGAGDTVSKSPHVPITPKQIAEACVEAANAGASIVHVHVRDPATGKGGRDPAHFAEVVERIRDRGTDIVLNLTAGMGGQLNLAAHDPSRMVEGTDLATPAERMRHVEDLLPEMCTLDCGSMNFADNVVINRVRDLEAMARIAQRCGVKPELEVFDLGQIEIARHLIEAGLIDGRPLFQLCLGIPWGAPATGESMAAMKAALPANADWAAFSISRNEFPMVAQAALLGGNCRVGLEDNLYLGKGQLATNGQLVERATTILESLGVSVMTPAEARRHLGLQRRWS